MINDDLVDIGWVPIDLSPCDAAGLGVGAAVGPIIPLPVLETETRVVRRSIPCAGPIGHGVDFVIQRLAIVTERQRQGKQRPWGLDLGPRDGIIGQRIGEGLTHDLIDIHARPAVGRIGVGQQHEGP